MQIKWKETQILNVELKVLLIKIKETNNQKINFLSIYISNEVETLDNFKTNDTLKKWALENMLKLYDFYMKYADDVKSIINDIKSK